MVDIVQLKIQHFWKWLVGFSSFCVHPFNALVYVVNQHVSIVAYVPVRKLQVNTTIFDDRTDDVNTELILATPSWFSLKMWQSSGFLRHPINDH